MHGVIDCYERKYGRKLNSDRDVVKYSSSPWFISKKEPTAQVFDTEDYRDITSGQAMNGIDGPKNGDGVGCCQACIRLYC